MYHCIQAHPCQAVKVRERGSLKKKALFLVNKYSVEVLLENLMACTYRRITGLVPMC